MWIVLVAAALAGAGTEEVRWDVAVRGPVAEAIVTQRFTGPRRPGLRAEYSFALPHEGVVDDMQIVVGDTVIQSAIRESRQARQEYEVAARDGQIAGLTSQVAGGVFRQELANIPAGQEVSVQLRVLWPVARVDGEYELVIPTDVAPRFAVIGETAAHSRAVANYPLTIDVDLEAGFDVSALHSPTFEDATTAWEGSHGSAYWSGSRTSGDMILRWSNDTNDTQAAAITSGDHSLLIMEGPAPTATDTGAIEWVLVVDTSGSMSGTPWRRAMELADSLLAGIGPDDTVAVLTFGDTIRSTPPARGSAGVQAARQLLQQTGPNGGTLLPNALRSATALPHDASMRRVMVLLTDGLVTDEDGSLTALASAGQQTDLAIVGVNASPNRALLDRLAVAAGGIAAYYLPGDTTRSVSDRVQTGLQSAKCVDVRVEWSTGVQAWPNEPGPLLPGRPMVIAAQHRETPAWAEVSCHLGGERWSRRVVPTQVDRGRGLQAAWARRNLEALLHDGWATNTDPRLKATALALEYGILSPWTSLVAVESRPNGDSRTDMTSLDLPEDGVDKTTVDVSSTSLGQVMTREFLNNLPGGRQYESPVGIAAGVADAGDAENAEESWEDDAYWEDEDDGMVIEIMDTPPAVDMTDTTRGQVLTREFLNQIPAGRSYHNALSSVTGVNGGGGNPTMAGSASNENTYMIDGVNITDPVTGTFSLNFNYDAIEQIEVLLGGYEPEYGVSLGGIVNLVTQTGTNNLEFDTSVYYVNGNLRPRMDARYTADGFTLAPSGFDSTFQSLQVNARVSGPIIRDKAWFLLSYQHDRSLTALTGVPVPRDYDGHYVMAKFTVQPGAEHRFTSLMQMNPSAIDNTTQGDPFVKPEAQGRQYQGGLMMQARWQWFLSTKANLDTQLVVQKTFLEVGSVPCTHNRDLGYHPCRPGEQEDEVDWDTPGRIGVSGALNSVSYGSFAFDDRLRYQGSTKLSIVGVTDPLGGSHDFKFGVEGIQTVWDQIQGISGNTQYYDLNRVAFDPNTFANYYWLEVSGPIKFRTSGSQFNVFVQDAYKPIDNLTIKYGLRFDNTVQRNDVGDAVLTGNLFGPRLYAAWDPSGRGRTKIAGGYGRFNDTGRLAVADYTSASSFGSKLFLGEFFGGRTGNAGFLNGPAEVYDVGPRTNPNLSHDTLRMPRVDEFLLMFEQEVVEDVAIAATVSRKMTHNLFEPDETNVIYDEDGSAVIGSRNANPFVNIQRLRTPQLARRDYVQADFEIRKVNSKRWFAQVAYSFAQSIGSSPGSNSGSFANDPQTQFNFGRLNTDLTHSVKAFGSWKLPTDPWTQSLGFSFSYNSGQPLERFYYSEESQSYTLRIRPRGQYFRFPGQWQFSLKFQQEIDVRKGKLTLDFEALNLFNNRAPESLSSLFYTENRLFTVARQPPLRLQFGLRYGF